jgi:hypothetical protein
MAARKTTKTKNAAKKTSTPDAVALARYKAELLPLLRNAGFSGTLANMSMQAGRAQLLAYLSRSSDRVTMGLTGNDGRVSFSLGYAFILAAHSHQEGTARLDAYIATIKKTALPRIVKMARESLPTAPKDLATAARALLGWLTRDRDFKGIEVRKVAVSGRELLVTVAGRRGPIQVDRGALVTLVRELRASRAGGKASATTAGGRDLRYALHGQELDAYLAHVAKDDPEEARTLWVHLESPYDVPEADHVLAHLFQSPLEIAKKLNVAASGGALVARALPYAAKKGGSLVDRMAAIRILTMMLDQVVTHRKADELLTAAARVAASLAEEKSPLLRECAWLLDEQVRRCRAALASERK